MKRLRLTAFDRKYFRGDSTAVVGVDEAGRGALAGPVVAAACLAPRKFYETWACRTLRPMVRDSKELTAEKREEAFRVLGKCRDDGMIFWASGVASVEEIADENILGATRLAMKRALDLVFEAAKYEAWIWQEIEPGDLFFCEETARGIHQRPVILIDGRPLRPFFYPHTALVKGDNRSFAIAAASIVAKVTRDRLLQETHTAFPLYGFDTNKGYGTPQHLDALNQHGICPLHRERFLRNFLAAGGEANGDVLFDLETVTGPESAG
jgi:ribonuclease HII